MGATEPPLPPARMTVLDAGPLIHLDELDALDLLEGFGDLLLPFSVVNEVRRHRPQLDFARVGGLRLLADPASLSSALLALARNLGLHRGEVAALGWLQPGGGGLFLSDDTAARLAAESLGHDVHGTLGLLLRAIRRGRRTASEIRALLEELPTRSTLHLDRRLLREILNRVPPG